MPRRVRHEAHAHRLRLVVAVRPFEDAVRRVVVGVGAVVLRALRAEGDAHAPVLAGARHRDVRVARRILHGERGLRELDDAGRRHRGGQRVGTVLRVLLVGLRHAHVVGPLRRADLHGLRLVALQDVGAGVRPVARAEHRHPRRALHAGEFEAVVAALGARERKRVHIVRRAVLALPERTGGLDRPRRRRRELRGGVGAVERGMLRLRVRAVVKRVGRVGVLVDGGDARRRPGLHVHRGVALGVRLRELLHLARHERVVARRHERGRPGRVERLLGGRDARPGEDLPAHQVRGGTLHRRLEDAERAACRGGRRDERIGAEREALAAAVGEGSVRHGHVEVDVAVRGRREGEPPLGRRVEVAAEGVRLFRERDLARPVERVDLGRERVAVRRTAVGELRLHVVRHAGARREDEGVGPFGLAQRPRRARHGTLGRARVAFRGGGHGRKRRRRVRQRDGRCAQGHGTGLIRLRVLCELLAHAHVEGAVRRVVRRRRPGEQDVLRVVRPADVLREDGSLRVVEAREQVAGGAVRREDERVALLVAHDAEEPFVDDAVPRAALGIVLAPGCEFDGGLADGEVGEGVVRRRTRRQHGVVEGEVLSPLHRHHGGAVEGRNERERRRAARPVHIDLRIREEVRRDAAHLRRADDGSRVRHVRAKVVAPPLLERQIDGVGVKLILLWRVEGAVHHAARNRRIGCFLHGERERLVGMSAGDRGLLLAGEGVAPLRVAEREGVVRLHLLVVEAVHRDGELDALDAHRHVFPVVGREEAVEAGEGALAVVGLRRFACENEIFVGLTVLLVGVFGFHTEETDRRVGAQSRHPERVFLAARDCDGLRPGTVVAFLQRFGEGAARRQPYGDQRARRPPRPTISCSCHLVLSSQSVKFKNL